MNGNGFSWAALIGIYAALIFDVFSSTNSSPQTTEMFAKDRANTLWKWVRIGAVISIMFIALAAFTEMRDKKTDKSTMWAPIIGGTMALGVMWWMYSNALKSGGAATPQASAAIDIGVDW